MQIGIKKIAALYQEGQITPDYIASTFSYLADDLRDMQRLVNDTWLNP
ncbi:hypothetical protein [Escherichia coli]|nr:hypothetical protein [Escherichia coli]